MSAFRVAVPVAVGSVTAHVAKGRRWSVVEHLLLEALCRAPSSASDLAAAAAIPERMVVEAIINLMRAGWVELRTAGKQSLFAATAGGRKVAGADDLPHVFRLVRRPVRYAIEKVTGSVLRYRDLDFFWGSNLPQVRDQIDVVLGASPSLPERRQTDVIASLLHEDEEYRGIVQSSAREGAGYAIVTVVGDKLKGLPGGASSQLAAAIKKVASEGTPRPEPLRLPVAPHQPLRHPVRRISFHGDDLILGGAAHRALLYSMITAARSLIVIHSTFVGRGDYAEVIDLLARAARERSVRVDILWGKTERPGEDNETWAACEAINDAMRAADLHQFVRAHPTSTRSHSKIVVADDGRDGFVAAVGSCNWLSSGFRSLEVSVRLADPLIVSDVMETVAQMYHAAIGLNGGIATRLSGYAVNIRNRTMPSIAKRGEVRLLLGPEHADYIREGRSAAERAFVIASHKLGRRARTMSILPACELARDGTADVRLYYDERAEDTSPEQAGLLSAECRNAGVSLLRALPGAMHAKFVAWDQDDVLITSCNLLSANPSSDHAEIGIRIRAPGAAKSFLQTFETLAERGEIPA